MAFHQILHPRRRRVTHVGLVVLWSMVAFYILASARALIPGLCATQAAMDAQCHIAEAGSCCATAEGPAESPSDAPVTPAESGCAFCNLLIAHTDPPLFVAAVPLPAPAPPRVPARVRAAAAGSAPGRRTKPRPAPRLTEHTTRQKFLCNPKCVHRMRFTAPGTSMPASRCIQTPDEELSPCPARALP